MNVLVQQRANAPVPPLAAQQARAALAAVHRITLGAPPGDPKRPQGGRRAPRGTHRRPQEAQEDP
jgi:hypothetical protein